MTHQPEPDTQPDLRQRIADTLRRSQWHRWIAEDGDPVMAPATPEELADAVLAQLRAMLDQARAEVERLRAENAGLNDLRLRAIDKGDQLRAEVERLRAERDRARETQRAMEVQLAKDQAEVERLRMQVDHQGRHITATGDDMAELRHAIEERDAELEQARAELERLAAAEQRVRELHREWRRTPDSPRAYCAHCEQCEDVVPWPCPTIRAVDGPAAAEEPDVPSQRPGGPIYETQLHQTTTEETPDITDGTDDDYCGAEPPSDGRWGDCWCTLPTGHDGQHQCEPCTDRHGAPGWDDAALDGPATTGETARDALGTDAPPLSTCPRTDHHDHHTWNEQPDTPAICPGHPAPPQP